MGISTSSVCGALGSVLRGDREWLWVPSIAPMLVSPTRGRRDCVDGKSLLYRVMRSGSGQNKGGHPCVVSTFNGERKIITLE